jgi:hypothetical protein
MEIKEPVGFSIKGKVTAIVYDEHGNIKQKVENPNTVVTYGKWSVGQKMSNASTTLNYARFIHVGTGVAAPSVNDTCLGGWVAFKTADFTQPNGTDTSWQLVATWGASDPNANVALSESAVCFTVNNTLMFSRQTFTVTKNTPDILTIIWQYSVS